MRKAQESGNAEGAEMRTARESRQAECDRIVGRWMNGRGVTERRTDGQTDRQTDGTYCAGVKDLASAYVLCPRLTEQCVSFYLEGSGSQKGLRKWLELVRSQHFDEIIGHECRKSVRFGL